MTLVERFGLDGKAALVVGGGYGIGRETSLLLAEAERGWRSPTSTPSAPRASPTR